MEKNKPLNYTLVSQLPQRVKGLSFGKHPHSDQYEEERITQGYSDICTATLCAGIDRK